MNIIDFLTENYIWILAIILITIVTIIGFLADKKKSGKKTDNVLTPQQPINNNQPQMQYQPVQELQLQGQSNIAQNNINQMPESMNQNLNINPMNNNQNMGTIPQPTVSDNQPQNIVNTMNNPQPVENIVTNMGAEPMYQPLSEQIPNIPPQPVPTFDAMQSQNIQEQPTIINNQMGNNLNTGNNQFTNPQPVMNNQQSMMTNQMTLEQSQFTQMPNYNTQSNMIQNQGTIPVPQPIMPEPIVTNQMTSEQSQFAQMPNYNMNQPMQNNTPNNMIQQNVPTNPQMSQMTQAQQQQAPINFVYGPQNNNQNM